MRKIFISLMCCIMSLIFTFFLVSCGKEECEHDWGNGVVKTEATCISGGEIEYTCGKCQATKTENTETIDHKKSKDYKYDSLGHYLYCTVCEENFEKEEHTMVDLEVQQEPTAYDAGIMITKCSKCDYKSTRVIDAVPHQKGADYKFDDNYHWYECEAHEDCTVEIQKGKHTLVEGKVIKEAEAEKDGLREISCSVCDYKGEVVIPALNHRKGELDFDDNEHWYTCDRHPDCDAKIELEAHTWVLVSDSATCTEDGTAVYKCSVCPKTKEEASKATGHDYKDWVVIQEAQENEPGKKERECRVCGHKETASIPVIGHEHEYDTEWTIDKEPTCTEVGSKSHHCQGCDEKQDVTEIPATGHNYSNWKVTKPATLYTDGIETIFCSVCDEEGTDTRKIQAQADFRNDFNLETADGTWKYGSIDYQWGSSEDFTFTVLENKSNDAWLGDNIELKSDWFNAGSMLAIAYTVTEDVNIVIKVSFTGGLPGTTKLALRVGIKNSTGEIYGNPEYKGMNNNVIEETLKRELKAGDTIYFIFGNEDNSGYPNGHISLTLTKEVIHNYSEEWTIDIEPTCTEAGSKSHHCLDCDEKKDITEIPATGHNYGQLVDKVDKTCTTAGMEAHYKCSACNTYFNSDKEEVTEDTLVIPASHDLEPHSAQEPTCTEVGWNAYETCMNCDYTTKEEIDALGHDYSVWKVTQDPTLYADGVETVYCSRCDEEGTNTRKIQAQADFRNDFNLETADGTWKYGSIDYHWDNGNETFDFTPATEKNGSNDGWTADGIEIKNDWINAEGMVGIAYTVTENVHIIMNLKFVGGTEATRLDLRIGVKSSEGTLYGNPSFHNNPDSNVLERLLQFNLNAGDTIYFIFSNGAGGVEGAWPNGNLNINLRKPSADFRNDFNLETADGTWKYGSVDYHWDNGNETFDFTPATEKNGSNDGWTADGIEIKNDWINAEGMVGIAYTVTENVHVVANLKFIGGTEGTRLDLRIGVKNSEGILYSNPSFNNNPDENVLELTPQFDLNAGDTIYFIFSNGANGVEGAWPNGNLNISIFQW